MGSTWWLRLCCLIHLIIFGGGRQGEGGRALGCSDSRTAAVRVPEPLLALSCLGFCLPERATDGSLRNEDWALNMEICDIINETEEG